MTKVDITISEVEMFTNIEFGTIRGYVDQYGNPWFILADICKALDIGSSFNSARLLDNFEKGIHNVNTPGGLQSMTFINLGGLYHLIFVSRKPRAKVFREWIWNEVLPALQKAMANKIAHPELIEVMEIVPPWVRRDLVTRERYEQLKNQLDVSLQTIKKLEQKLADREAKIQRFIQQRMQYESLPIEQKRALEQEQIKQLKQDVERYKYKSTLDEHYLTDIGLPHNIGPEKMEYIIDGIQNRLDYDDEEYVETGRKYYEE